MFTLSLKSSVRPSLPSVTPPLCVCACVCVCVCVCVRACVCVCALHIYVCEVWVSPARGEQYGFEILDAVVIEHGSLITRLPGRCTITMTYHLGE